VTDKQITNMGDSVRQRLLNLRKVKGGDYNALLMQYAIERFLYRLSRSELADRFVLKGAMLFRVWADDLHRPTKDLDLLGFGEATLEAVATAVRTIIAVPVGDDGLVFNPDTIAVSEIREQRGYGGVRVKFLGMLGNARIPMQIDVGFGDAIIPEPDRCTFPTLLGQDAPELWAYPPATVVAEKLEAIVSRGIVNSRMKDFYDILLVFRLYDLEDDDLSRAIAATFRRQQTPLPHEIPVGLSAEYGHDRTAQQRWSEFLRRLRIEEAPAALADVVDSVRTHVWPAMQRAQRFI